MNKLYSIEEIEEWASKRADDAGRLSRQLLDTLRENERLTAIEGRLIMYGCLNPEMGYQVMKILGRPNKHTEADDKEG